jgi:cell division protein ZapA (FtsZ GTPase activity inhibitor)
MNSSSQKYRVSIFGQTYSLVSDESEEQLLAAAKSVDRMMREIAPQSTEVDVAKVAVLTALRLTLENADLTQQVNEHAASHTRLMNLLTHIDAV